MPVIRARTLSVDISHRGKPSSLHPTSCIATVDVLRREAQFASTLEEGGKKRTDLQGAEVRRVVSNSWSMWSSEQGGNTL